MARVDMLNVCLLVATCCGLCTQLLASVDADRFSHELPEWGILITTTKTVLVRKGIVLKTKDSVFDETIRLDRRRPRGP